MLHVEQEKKIENKIWGQVLRVDALLLVFGLVFVALKRGPLVMLKGPVKGVACKGRGSIQWYYSCLSCSLLCNYRGESHCIKLPNVGQLIQATGITYYPAQEPLSELLDCLIRMVRRKRKQWSCKRIMYHGRLLKQQELIFTERSQITHAATTITRSLTNWEFIEANQDYNQ